MTILANIWPVAAIAFICVLTLTTAILPVYTKTTGKSPVRCSNALYWEIVGTALIFLALLAHLGYCCEQVLKN